MFVGGDALTNHTNAGANTVAGPAYPSNPPPLASLEGILGTKPPLDDLNLYVRSFARIAFEPESGGKLYHVAKWPHSIEIALTGRRTTDYDATLHIVAEQLVRITGLPINVQLLRNPRDKLLTPIHPAFPKYRRYSVRREGDSAIRIMKL